MITKAAENADLLISEAAFSEEDSQEAKLRYHATAFDVGKIANIAKVRRLALIHISARYKDISKIVNEALVRLIAYLIVPLKILDPNYQLPSEIPEIAVQMASEELTRIEEHSAMVRSSILRFIEDYTQYKPRGYYTYNETLKRYFKSVMFLGRMYFPINFKNNETFSDVTTAMGLTLTYLVLTSQVNISNETWYAIDVYERMYYITAFLVGYSDDLTFEDYEKVIEDIYNSEFTTQLLTDINKLQEAKNELKELDHSKILGGVAERQSETIGLRFMGQRFLLDSYVFQNLIYDKVADRFLPTALDIPAVFNFSRARYHLRDTIQSKKDYKENLENLTKEFATMNTTQWTTTIYNGWLYTLKAALRENYTGFPTFMQTDAWKDEKLNTFCGSWTELRHDTILYAKQSYAKLTAAPPASHKGFVEPLPLLWSRLKGLILQLRNGLNSLDMLPERYNNSLSSLYEILDVLLNVFEDHNMVCTASALWSFSNYLLRSWTCPSLYFLNGTVGVYNCQLEIIERFDNRDDFRESKCELFVAHRA